MITKEKVKQETDRLSEMEVEKVYLYISTLLKIRRKEAAFPLINSVGG